MSFLRRFLDRFSLPRATSTLGYEADESPLACIASLYEAWAAERGLRIQHDAERRELRVSGVLAGRSIVVDPGIDRGHPGWVQVTVSVALPAARALLVTRATEPEDAITARIRALFDGGGDVALELRAISIGPRHVRLRLAPGAAPDVVEAAVQSVADAMRSLHGAPTSSPRQSCMTTVPYPAS